MNPGADREGMVGQRSLFSLVYRLAVRAGQFAVVGRARPAWTAGLIGAVVGDVALARALRVSDRPHLVPRLVGDSIDAALWSEAPGMNPNWPCCPACRSPWSPACATASPAWPSPWPPRW